MIDTNTTLGEAYLSLLRDYVADPREEALHEAYELCRTALKHGLSVVQIMEIHHDALATVLRHTTSPEESAQVVARAAAVASECLAVFEMTLRGYEEARDINEQFRAVVETATDAVISADERGTIVFVNKAAEQMFGYRMEELLDEPLTVLMPERFQGPHRAGLSRYLTSGQARVIGRTVELLGRRKNGAEFPLELSLASWKKEDQPFFTAVIRDITEHKQAERIIRERSLQLEAANKELEAFSYSVSHDLRAPLRAMDGLSHILLQEFAAHLPEEAQRYLRLVRDNAQQMDRLIQDLLAFARLNRQPLDMRPVDLAALARQALDSLSAERGERRVEVNIGELPPCRGDAALLRQVLVNLLGNALKYSRGLDVATIEVGCLTDGTEPVYFIRDNGVGFDMKYANKLFGVFQRLHRLDEFEGTGVGLAIVQRIVFRHGGRVWAEAKVDQGATFFFTLGGGP